MRYPFGMSAFRRIFEEEKLIAYFPGWSSSEEETGYIWFDAPLDIGGVTEAGLVLHGGAYVNMPEQHVTLELIVRNLKGKRRIALARLDWRSLKGGHTNPRGGPKGLSGKRMPPTHLHDFEINHDEKKCRMSAGLRWARPIEPELLSFEDVRAFAGKHFRINNMQIVDTPTWEYDLFGDEH
jgi:hypothetical protein